MNLFSSTGHSVAWVTRIYSEFWRVRWWATLGVLIASTLKRVFHLAAVFLPLKVILLISSGGVPRYFRGFIDPEQRDAWIVGLAASAIVSYFLSLLAGRIADRISARSSLEVLQGANTLTIFSRQAEMVHDVYSSVSGLFSSLFFVIVIVGVGAYFSPLFFSFFIGLLVVTYLITALLFGSGEHSLRTGVAVTITRGLGTYLQVTGSLIFLASFVFLLYAFLVGLMSNALVAILSVMVLRQTLSALTGMIRKLVDLRASMWRVNALVFRHETLTRRRSREMQALFHFFVEGDPVETVQTAAERAGIGLRVKSVKWNDPRAQGLYRFDVEYECSAGLRHSEMQLFFPSRLQWLENEQLLFRHLDRALVSAPEIAGRMELRPFAAQLFAEDLAGSVAASEWLRTRNALRQQLWSVEPPPDLVSAYTMSKALLGDRISGDLFMPLPLAATGDDARTLQQATERLPEIRQWLRSMPLVIDNPEITRANVRRAGEGERVCVMTWGRWMLSPLGGAGQELTLESARRLLSELRTRRGDLPDSITEHHLRFASLCAQFESLMTRHHYSAAVRMLRRVLDAMPQ